MSVLALIPARSGSKGIPHKNSLTLGGSTILERAVICAQLARCDEVWLSTDIARFHEEPMRSQWYCLAGGAHVLQRPSELAQDDTPMIAVVRHALAAIPGPEDQIIVLLQPTQPFRTPAHVTQAIALLRETQADSVMSVVPLPLTHSPEMVGIIIPSGRLKPWSYHGWPIRRQDVTPVYKRDGTVYAFWRKTVTTHGTIYGRDCRPLILDPSESCELDTEADWAAVEARWQAQHG